MEQAGMTKFLKLLGASGLAAVLGLVLFGAVAFAESPPSPPSRFTGTVTVDGKPATPGTTVEAHIGSTTCGVASVTANGAESRFLLDSPALDPGANPNCGTDGATVTFFVGGKQAAETGTWHNYQLNTVNLTVVTITPTASATAATPKPPVTGSGVSADGSGTAVWLYALLGLGALAFGVGGAAAARKSR
jgi:hypothetical protein